MDKSKRLKILLEKGYFPSELPPPFVTHPLAKFRSSILRQWDDVDGVPKTKFETYSVPRVGNRRRKLAITNPISQTLLSKAIADNWIEIRQFVGSSRIALDTPNLAENQSRAIPKPDFNQIKFKRLETEARHAHILVSDISRFYGTIYTHTLPWALHTKDHCKSNINNNAVMQNLLGDKLDRLVRKGQDNQTIGIPIGPDTSRILSEIIAVGIEKKFIDLSGLEEDRVFRYVDDWFVGFDNAGQAEDSVSMLCKACSEYEMELNDEKTRVVDPFEPTEENWPSELQNLNIRPSGRAQREDLAHYFSRAFELAGEHHEKNVLDYAIKITRSKNIADENLRFYEVNLLKAARINPSSFQVVAEILINLNYQGRPITKQDVMKLICDTINSCAELGKHGELAWALFLAKGLRIRLPQQAIQKVANVESSVCALLSLDLKKMGLLETRLDTSFWQSFMNGDSLTDEMWLLAYEANFKGWLPSPNNHVDSHPFFSVLKRKKVFFYDEGRNVPKTIKALRLLRQETQQRASIIRRIFNFDYFD